MEQLEKGLFMGIGIFFFIGALFVSGIYYRGMNRLIDAVNEERERTYIMEGADMEEHSIE